MSLGVMHVLFLLFVTCVPSVKTSNPGLHFRKRQDDTASLLQPPGGNSPRPCSRGSVILLWLRERPLKSEARDAGPLLWPCQHPHPRQVSRTTETPTHPELLVVAHTEASHASPSCRPFSLEAPCSPWPPNRCTLAPSSGFSARSYHTPGQGRGLIPDNSTTSCTRTGRSRGSLAVGPSGVTAAFLVLSPSPTQPCSSSLST